LTGPGKFLVEHLDFELLILVFGSLVGVLQVDLLDELLKKVLIKLFAELLRQLKGGR